MNMEGVKMTKKIKGDLILKEDTVFNESIEVEGDIKGYFNLRVAGNIVARNIVARNIDARNIDAGNIDAWNIDAGNIDAENIDAGNIDAWNIIARNIDAWNIDAWNIDAWNTIYCEDIKVKAMGKVRTKVLTTGRSKLEMKEWKVKTC